MAISPSDTKYSIIKEVTAGTTPATPTFIPFDYIPGTQPNFSAQMVSSAVLKQNRASAGARKAAYKVDQGLKTQLRRGTHIDAFLESGLSGAFASSVLKASNVDSSYTIEKSVTDGTNTYYKRYTGCQVNSVGLSVQASGNAEINFTVLGMGMSTGNAILTGATYPSVATSTNLMGLDVSTLTIAGLTGVVANQLDLTVTHNREAQDQFGSPSARAIGTSGFRTVTLKVQFYRTDLSAETLMQNSDSPIAVSFTIGAAAGSGYTFLLPAANYTVPMDMTNNSKEMVEVTFTASFDATTGTDLQITKN